MNLRDIFKRKPEDLILPEIAEYSQGNFNQWDKYPPDQSEICVIDCETTGFDRRDYIISTGGLLIRHKTIMTNTALNQIYPHEKASKDAEIHGELSNTVTAEVLRDNILHLLSFLSNRMIAGHNIRFDVEKLNQAIHLIFPGIRIKNKLLDTYELEKRIDPVKYQRKVGGEDISLESLCEQYYIPIENRHTALGDAYLTAQVLLHQLSRLKNRGIKKTVSLVAR